MEELVVQDPQRGSVWWHRSLAGKPAEQLGEAERALAWERRCDFEHLSLVVHRH